MEPLFQKVISDNEAKAKKRDAYDRIVVAGLKLMFSKDTHAMLMEGIDEAPDVAAWAGEGVVGVLGMLAKNAKGTMPFDEMLLAGVTLLMHGLDFLAQEGRVEPSVDTITVATKAYGKKVLSAGGVSDEQLSQMADQATQATQDPARAEVIKKHFAGA